VGTVVAVTAAEVEEEEEEAVLDPPTNVTIAERQGTGGVHVRMVQAEDLPLRRVAKCLHHRRAAGEPPSEGGVRKEVVPQGRRVGAVRGVREERASGSRSLGRRTSKGRVQVLEKTGFLASMRFTIVVT
jgi:hypothetical protein